MQKPSSLCLAPWTHTFISPISERRMCCASREPAQNFRQYIDTESGTGTYIPITLEQHWNSEHMKSVRRRMIAGETLPECEVCNDQLLNTVGRGVQCNDCGKKEAELYEKYYPTNK